MTASLKFFIWFQCIYIYYIFNLVIVTIRHCIFAIVWFTMPVFGSNIWREVDIYNSDVLNELFGFLFKAEWNNNFKFYAFLLYFRMERRHTLKLGLVPFWPCPKFGLCRGILTSILFLYFLFLFVEVINFLLICGQYAWNII